MLGIDSGTHVLDVGCGTGKFTGMAAGTTEHVVGVEPLPSMADAFRRRLPGVPLVAGVAESLPFRDERFDLVVCASAFHWFRHDQAIPELHRVLRPGGRLGIAWNRRDNLTGWAAEFWAITEAHRRDTPGYRSGAWRSALESSPRFGPIAEHHFDHVQRLDRDGLLARVGSISFIETLPAGERDDVFEQCRTFLQTHPQTRELEQFELPYRTAVYVSRRLS